jgi:hypothetical protein
MVRLPVQHARNCHYRASPVTRAAARSIQCRSQLGVKAGRATAGMTAREHHDDAAVRTVVG